MTELALSIRQPWAWLIIHKGKNIENRTWYSKHRGPLLIHAAKSMSQREYDSCQDFCYRVADHLNQPCMEFQLPSFLELERGGVIGRVQMADCVSDHTSPWFTGSYGFVLRHPEPLPFRCCNGRLGIFEL